MNKKELKSLERSGRLYDIDEYYDFYHDAIDSINKISHFMKVAQSVHARYLYCREHTDLAKVSHRQFSKDLDTIRKELVYKTYGAPKQYDGYEGKTVEFYHPKWPDFVIMKIVEDYESEELVKTYYKHPQMVEIIKSYVCKEQN